MDTDRQRCIRHDSYVVGSPGTGPFPDGSAEVEIQRHTEEASIDSQRGRQGQGLGGVVAVVEFSLGVYGCVASAAREEDPCYVPGGETL